MNSDLIAKIAQIASVLEVSGHPKPGNVHRTRDYDDMCFEDFLISGIVIGDLMKKAAERGSKYRDDYSLHKIRLGEIIKEAVIETDKWIGNNTNLGIIMMLTPISVAAGMSHNFDDLRKNAERVMEATTSRDALNLYDAINIADAGGMGEQDELDVSDAEARARIIKEDISMYKVLEMSSKWDLLSYELTNGLPVTFETGFPTFKEIKHEYGINKATIQTFLTILSKNPDTLISRKYGNDMARIVSADADSILQNGGILDPHGEFLINEFDKQLIKNKLNPGTTADLTASSIMVAFLEESWFK
ncbi:MAG: triphosphoribosyl-dephospho-CoA synthase [Methanobacterium sp.]|uniref:triphosphoribosyl-dephospho-CoA synthase n=1 Tax=Methanobacterium sp. TaxID=2164 RepID=UPI003D654F06|nr:triphosphoribosyl-dephospho-CoA synthase [Methanobacterium sp.]